MTTTVTDKKPEPQAAPKPPTTYMIWKYALPTPLVDGLVTISTPPGTILSVGVQDNGIFAWIEFDFSKVHDRIDRTFRVCNTGHAYQKNASDKFIGTFAVTGVNGGSIVWHVYGVN